MSVFLTVLSWIFMFMVFAVAGTLFSVWLGRFPRREE